MSAKLISFRYISRGASGWHTPELLFGELFTAVQGPNGTGKTPVMKGIVHALGHEVELPPQIITNCGATEITLSIDGAPVRLTRPIEQGFRVRVEHGETAEDFVSQSEYSKWFCTMLGGDARVLTTKADTPSPLYATVILPAFWVDQDNGWRTAYFTPPNRDFIRDQREEVVRFLMGLPPRRPFKDKSDFALAKAEFEKAEKAVELQRFVVERLRSSGQVVDSDFAGLVDRRNAVKAELEANSKTVEAVRQITSFLDADITRIEGERAELMARSGALTRRKGQLSLVLSELSGEVEILAANVQAGELLRQFCSREGCEMFADAERSYGRSLLYLRDQVKDLKASDGALDRDSDAIATRVQALDSDLANKRRERDTRVAASPQAQLMTKLDALTKQLVDTELGLARHEQYRVELEKFERLLDKLEQARAVVDLLRPRAGRGSTDPIEDVRRQLTDSMEQWLAALSTENTGPASFDDDFALHLGGSKFTATSHQSGSTRTRIVLAFHAALLEVALARGGHHPGWLIFDAPKQHELSQQDFDVYMERLKAVSERRPGRVQIVFSVADLRTHFEVTDEVWDPSFTVDGKLRFLGPVAPPT